MADGSTLPPVIITNKKFTDCFATEEDYDKYAHVLVFPKSKGPGVKTTTAALDGWVQQGWLDYSAGGKCLLLCDRLKAHHNANLVAHLQDFNVEVVLFPVGAGAVLNPCDNSFHAQAESAFRKHLFRDLFPTIEHKMQAIEHAYHSVKEGTIRRYFKSCGLIPGRDMSMKAAQQKAAELCRTGNVFVESNERTQEVHTQQLAAFRAFAQKCNPLKRSSAGWAPAANPDAATFDGPKWQHTLIS